MCTPFTDKDCMTRLKALETKWTLSRRIHGCKITELHKISIKIKLQYGPNNLEVCKTGVYIKGATSSNSSLVSCKLNHTFYSERLEAERRFKAAYTDLTFQMHVYPPGHI